MKTRVVIPLLVALVLGGVAVVVGKDVLQRRANGGVSVKTEAVLLAAADLAPGQEIAAADLKPGVLPAGSVPATALTRLADAVGRTVVVPVARGQILFDASLAPRGNEGMGALVPRGMRAIEVSSFSGVASLLRPNSRVDVIAAFQDERSRQSVARVLAENAKVVAVENAQAGREARGGRSVTLLVSAAEAVAIKWAESKGQLQLALRGAGDEAPSGATILKASDLAGIVEEVQQQPESQLSSELKELLAAMRAQQAQATQPAAPQDVRRAIFVIRGGNETVSYVDEEGQNIPGKSSRTQTQAAANGSAVQPR